jgi:hypothetical protein
MLREEKVRKLEQQLRNAYGSMGRAALRATGGASLDVGVAGSVRISRIGLAAAQAPVAQSLDETIEVGWSLEPASPCPGLIKRALACMHACMHACQQIHYEG